MDYKDKGKGKGKDRRKIELLSELLGIMIPAESEITIEIKLNDRGGEKAAADATASTSRVVFALSKGDIKTVSSHISPILRIAIQPSQGTLYW